MSTSDQLEPGDLLTIQQVLQIIPISRSTLYRLMDAGEIRVLDVSPPGSSYRKVLVRREEVERFVRDRESPPVIAVPAEIDVDAIAARCR